MATTFDVLYLGTVAALDPTEGNIIAENAGAIVGTTFGSSGDPLNTHIHTLTPGTTSYTGGQLNDAYDVDNNIANEQFRIDGGVNQTMDAVVVYNATVTYVDGTTASITAVLFQDTAGRLYLAPEVTQNADQAVLEAKPIQSLKLNSVSSDETLLTASRDVAEFMDVITGTTGNDTMNPGYTDANGDIIDGADGNNDYIDGGSGNDSINAGLGDDIVVGGNGNDTITGDAGNDTLYGNDGNDIFVIVDDDDTDVIVGGENTGDFDAIAFAHFAAAQGVTRRVSFRRSKVCLKCDGSGHRPGSSPEACRRCGGRGRRPPEPPPPPGPRDAAPRGRGSPGARSSRRSRGRGPPPPRGRR